MLYGAINGITRGLTNGNSNGSNGITNGFLNGSGAVNGFRLSYEQRRVGAVRVDFRKRLLIIAVLVTIIVALPYALVYSFTEQTVEIDGYFMDWLKAQVFKDAPDSTNPDISLIGYGAKSDVRGSYFYIRTEGTIFNGRDNGVDAFYIFIDRDNDPSSGYSVRGLGADVLVVVMGWNRTMTTAETYVFDSDASKLDFSGFQVVSGALAASSKGELEIASSILISEESRMAVCASHTNLTSDWSDVNFRTTGSALQVKELHNAPAVLAASSDQRILTLKMSSKGPVAYIDELRFDMLGNVTPLEIVASEGPEILGTSLNGELTFQTSLRVEEQEHSIDITATLPTEPIGGTFGLQLNRTSGFGVDSNVTWVLESVQTGARVAYVGAAPARVVIDGAFGEWALRAPIQDLTGDAYSEKDKNNRSGDVDITTVKLASTNDVASFYMAVNGTMLGGSSVPSSLVRWVRPGAPAENVTVISEPMYGADFAFVFIDTDGNQSTGYSIGGAEMSLVVVGKANSIISSRVFSFVSDSWNDSGPIDAAIDEFQLEINGQYSSLGLVSGRTYTVTFVAQDWSGRKDDIALPLPARSSAGTRAYPGILINEIYSKSAQGALDDWIEFYNTGAIAIDMTGWQVWAGGVLVYTFPSVTIQPGQIYLLSRIDLGKATNFMVTAPSGAIIDQVSLPGWPVASYGRTGNAPYSSWNRMNPTPGAINRGQTPIPEFGSVLLPASIVPIILMVIRRSGRAKGVREEKRGRLHAW
jgi:hypothetical protein